MILFHFMMESRLK